MKNEKRLINVWKLVIDLAKLERSGQYDHENVLAVIASQETVDAVRVVHSYWEKSAEGYRICHYCKADVAIFSGHKNYCPNCGAKMDGDGDEN